MIRKPNTKTLITLFNKIEKSLARENYKDVVKSCKVFISWIETYDKQSNSLNKERR